MKLRAYLLCILLLSGVVHLAGQDLTPTDSLRQLISDHPKEDTARVNLMTALAKSFLNQNLDSAEFYYNKSLKASLDLKYTDGQINSMNGLGVCFWYKNNTKATIHTFKQALMLAQETQNASLATKVAGNLGSYYNVLGISDSAEYYQLIAIKYGKDIKDRNIYAKALGDLGLVYYNKGNYLAAIDQYMKAKEILEVTKSYRDLTSLYTKLGMIYYDFNDFDKAITAYRNAQRTNRLHKEKSFDAEILQNMGLAYFDLKKEYDTATMLLKQAIIMGKKQNRKDVEITAMANLGNIQTKIHNYAKAVHYYINVLNSPVIHKRNKLKAAVLTSLGYAYFNLGNIEKARSYTQEGLNLSIQQGYRLYQRHAYQTLSKIAVVRKDYPNAFVYLQSYSNLQDSLENEEIIQKANEAVFKNAIQQKENENLLLQKDNQINQQTIRSQRLYIVIFGIIVLLGGLLLAHRIRTNRKLNLLNKTLDQKNTELHELNLLRAKLYSIIAHDLKAPFTGLLGILDELDENYDRYDEKTRHDMIAVLKRSSHNTYNLLVNLLDWTRLQKGQISVNPRKFRMKDLTDEVVSILSSRAVAKQQELVTDVNDTEGVSDPEIIKSILLNLTNNAIKFSHAGSTIHLKAETEGDNYYFEVRDSGVGIPAEELRNIFSLDMKFQRKGTAKEPGTGLGLIMSKEFVQLLGGQIGAESTPDKGSRFYFTVPRRNISDQN